MVKRVVQLLLICFFCQGVAISQCTKAFNTHSSLSLPSCGSTVTSTSNVAFTQRLELTVGSVGRKFTVTLDNGTANSRITITNSTNTVVAYGISPLIFTSATAGIHYAYINNDASCSNTWSNNSMTLRYTRENPNPGTASVTYNCNNNFSVSVDDGSSFEWQGSNDNTSWVNIAGATGTTLTRTSVNTPVYSAFRRQATFDGCSLPSSSVAAQPFPNQGTISNSTQTICEGASFNPVSITGVTGSASFLYEWFVYTLGGTPPCPTSLTPPAGWIAAVNGTHGTGFGTTSITPASNFTGIRVFACKITPTGSPACGTAFWTGCVVLNVNRNPTINVGSAIAAICQGATSAALGGTSGGGATGAIWTATSGTFSNNTGSTPNIATFTAASNSATPITLTLTSMGGNCGTVVASKTITVNPVLVPSVSIALTTGANPACNGTNLVYTATVTNGGVTPSYQWTRNGVNISGATSATYTANAGTNIVQGDVIRCVVNSNAVCASPTTVTSNSISMSVQTVTAPTVAIALTAGSNPSCTGSSLSYTATPTNAGSAPSYQWTKNGVNLSGATSATYAATAGTDVLNGDIIRCIFSSTPACLGTVVATSNAITTTVNTLVTPTISIAVTSGTNPACNGTTISFTATPTNPGTTPTYQWTRNGVNISGATGSVFTGTAGTTFVNGDLIRCVLTSSISCATSSTITSTPITLIVNALVTASVSSTLTTGTNPACSGSNLQFTAIPTNGGTTPTYQWTRNGTNILGETSSTFNAIAGTNISNGDLVRVSMTSSNTCASPRPVLSAPITMGVNPVLTPTVSINASATSICAGTSVTFTATSVNGGSTPVYQWRINGNNVGTNTASFVSNSLINGDIVTVVMTANNTCQSIASVTSNSITITVNPILVPSVTIAASATTICAGTSVNFTATPTNGGISPTYRWFRNGATIGGATAATYSSAGLVQGDAIRVEMTPNNACQTIGIVNSNVVTMAVQANITNAVTVAASSINICGGDPITFTASPNVAGTTPTYQWKLNNVDVGTNSATYTLASPIAGQEVKVVYSSSFTCPSGNQTVTSTPIILGNTTVTPSITIAASATTVCNNTTVNFTAIPTNGGATPGFQWTKNGLNISGANSSTYSAVAGTGFVDVDAIRCVLTSNANCRSTNNATSAPINMSVQSNLVPTVSINASATTICTGTTVIFAATPVNGGTSPVYQWKLNGNNVGTNSTTYSNSTLVNGDVVSVVLTANNNCQTTPTATSNAITMVVNAIVTPSVTIGASATAVCAGTSVTFTATPVNGGSSPVYQWTVNGLNAGTNSNSFVSTSLLQGDIVRVRITANNACQSVAVAQSNQVSMVINANLTPSVNITSAATTICAGSSISFTATPTNGGTTPAYQWQKNGSNIPGAINSTYSTTTAVQGDVFRVVLTTNNACQSSPTAVSNSITANVIANITPSVTIVSDATTICASTNVNFTATPTNPGSSPSYQWKVNGTNVGTNANTYSSNGLVNGVLVTVVLTSNNTCQTSSTATSNAINMTVNPVLVPSVTVAASPNPYCVGSNISFTATPVNGGSLPTYQWLLNNVPIGGATNSSYTANNISSGSTVSVTMVANNMCQQVSSATSSAVTVTANTPVTPSVSISASVTTICAGDNVLFTATPTNGGSSPAYQWKKNGIDIAGAVNASYTTASINSGDVFTVVLTANNSCQTTATSSSAGITITVNPIVTPTVTISSNSNSVCGAAPILFTATAANAGAAPVYQWKLNGNNVGVNSSSYGLSNPTAGMAISVVVTTNNTCQSIATINSNTITLSNANVTPAVVINASATSICNNTPVTFTATPTNGGVGPSYQWRKNGVNIAGATLANYTATNIANGEIYSVSLVSNASCTVSPNAISNDIPISVVNNLAPSVSISSSASTICSGTAVNFTATPVNGGAAPAYQWRINGNNVGSNSAIFTTNTLSSSDIISVVLTSNNTCQTSNTSISNGISVAVNNNVTPTVSVSTLASTVCANTNVSFAALANNAGSLPAYQWKLNGVNVGTNSDTYSNATLASGDIVTVVVLANNTCQTTATALSAPLVMTVKNNLVPSLTIAANATTICAGAGATFSAVVANGGTNPLIQWKLNGANVGSGGNAYTAPTVANNDIVSATLTANNTCQTIALVNSNNITMTVNPNVVPSVSIASSANNICRGTSVVFTATPVNGGVAPSYQWKVNGINVGTNSASYTTTSLNNNDVVSVVMTANNPCQTTTTVTSNNITMIVNAGVTPSVSITLLIGGNPFCIGSPGTMKFLATPTNGGATPTYQWRVNGVNVGANNTEYQIFSPNNGDVIDVILTANNTCQTTATANSNTITLIGQNQRNFSVSLTASASTVCAGNPIVFTATPDPTIATNSKTYRWFLNNVDQGPFTVGDGNPQTFTLNSPVANDAVKITMSGNRICPGGSLNATSPTITLVNGNVTPLVSISTSASTICAGTSVVFTATPTNGGQTPNYQWRKNGNNINGETAATYTTSTLSNSDVIDVVLTSSLNCVNAATATSNSILMKVTSNIIPSVQIVADAAGICEGSNASFSATVTNGGTNPTYQWKVDGVNVGLNQSSFSSTTLTNGQVVLVEVIPNNTCQTVASVTSNSISANIATKVNPTVSVLASNTTICAGALVAFTATATNEGANPLYQWRVNGIAVGNNSTVFSTNALSSSDIVTVDMTSNQSCLNFTTANSSPISIQVNSFIVPAVSVTATATAICANNSITYTANITNGGITPIYNWKLNNNSVGSNSATYTLTNPSEGDIVSLNVVSNAACLSSTNVTYALPALTNSNVTPLVTISATKTILCSGEGITFTAFPTNGGSNPIYQWKINGNNVGTNSNTFTASNLSNNDVVTAQMTANNICQTNSLAASNAVTLQVISNLTPTVSVTASSTAICENVGVLFTASSVNGGASPVYQWKLNGINVGTNSTTYNNTSLVNGDAVQVVLSANNSCQTTSTASSAIIPISVTANTIPSVSIISSATTICAGTNVIFNASSINAGSTPTYQWFVNNAQVGSNTSTFSSASLSDKDVVQVTIRSNATCQAIASASSNTIAISVTTQQNPTIKLVASKYQICAGSAVNFEALLNNAGSAPVVQWKVNNINVGTNSTNYTTNSLANGDKITAILTANNTCQAYNSIGSDMISMIVNPNIAASVTISSSTTTICKDSTLRFKATATNAGSNPMYQWMINAQPVTGNSNENTFSTVNLRNSDIVTAKITANNTCQLIDTYTSNSLTINVRDIVTPSVYIDSTLPKICTGVPVTLQAIAANADATPIYTWRVNNQIVGTNSPQYTGTQFKNLDVVTVVMKSSNLCQTDSLVISNALNLQVDDTNAPAITINASSSSTCGNNPISFTAKTVNIDALATYQWVVNNVVVSNHQNGFTLNTPVTGDSIELRVTNAGGCAINKTIKSNGIRLQNGSVTPIILITAESKNICSDSTTIFQATTVHGGTTPQYQWKIDGVNAGANSSIFIPGKLKDSAKIICVLTSNANCLNTALVESVPIFIRVRDCSQKLFVKELASGKNDGTSWENAFNDLQSAIAVASPGSEIWVAKGTYKPTNTSNRFASFSLPRNVNLYGGFVGFEASILERPSQLWSSSSSILSGDIGIKNNDIDNVYQVMAVKSGSAIIDGFVIIGANSFNQNTIETSKQIGGGLLIGGSFNGIVSNILFDSNSANYGGALGIVDQVANPSISSCYFINNKARLVGGAVLAYSPNFNKEFVNTVFSKNTAGNDENNFGGAIFAFESGEFSLMNCTISGNSSGYGGALALQNNKAIKIRNSILYGNTALVGNSIVNSINSSIEFQYSLTDGSIIGAGNINANPLFKNTTNDAGSDGIFGTLDDGLSLQPASKAIDKATNVNSPVTDITRTSRPTGIGIDMGAYENCPPLTPSVVVSSTKLSSCMGDSVRILAVPTNGGLDPTYIWRINGNIVSGINAPSLSTNKLSNGDSVTVTLRSNANCVTNDTAVSVAIRFIVVDTVSTSVTIQAEKPAFCEGSVARFNALLTNGGSAPNIIWLVNNVPIASGVSFQLNSLKNKDQVSVRMASSITCPAEDTVSSVILTMVIHANPIINAGNDTLMIKGQPIQLTANSVGSGINTWSWTPVNTLTNASTAKPIANPSSLTQYIVQAVDINTCISTDTIMVQVVDGLIIPNAFSPNGDGINDTWKITYLNVYPEAVVSIFDRYGIRLFESKRSGIEWNGFYKEKSLPIGTYYYIIDPKNGQKILNGSVTIIK